MCSSLLKKPCSAVCLFSVKIQNWGKVWQTLHSTAPQPPGCSRIVNLLDAAHRRRLVRTAGLLETMISRGDRALGYFSFL